jgi:hypothetical protein
MNDRVSTALIAVLVVAAIGVVVLGIQRRDLRTPEDAP